VAVVLESLHVVSILIRVLTQSVASVM